MRKQIKAALLFSFFCCGYINARPQAGGHIYALVAGISDYADPGIPGLSFADKDAQFFYEWLQTKSAGDVPQYNIKLLTNKNATVAAFYNALDWLKKSAKENDLVYIYFSGHGDMETKDGVSSGYLLASNSPPNNYLNNAISVSDLNNTAQELTTKNKAKIILITDACHSGKMAGDFYKGRRLTAANLRLVLNNQVRIASCREDEEAAEGQDWGGGRGVFSYYLLKGLDGEAVQNATVKLEGLQQYMDSAFANDRELKMTKHIQHPISDGSPSFTLAQVDHTLQVQMERSGDAQRKKSFVPGLQSLRSVGMQPMDYFFEILSKPYPQYDIPLTFRGIEDNDGADTIILRMTDSIIEKEKVLLINTDQNLINDSIRFEKEMEQVSLRKGLSDSIKTNSINFFRERHSVLFLKKKKENAAYHDPLNHLLILRQQLKDNSYSRTAFAERFVQMIHDKSQNMINAYLRSDGAELESRQYYSSGISNYRNFIPMMKIAVKLAPEHDYLKEILSLNTLYIQGLVDRLEIAVNKPAADSLLKSASAKMQEAIYTEPYSAYIRNEMGNLYFQQKKYDSALICFNYASLLAPAWVIPYSNKIRAGLALNDTKAAAEAAQIADSLQPGIAFVKMNEGLAMERSGDLLAAESFYLSAIETNNTHFFPYERMAYLYMRTGDYEKADSFFYEAKQRKSLLVNDNTFEFGVEMGLKPLLPHSTMAKPEDYVPKKYDDLRQHNFKKYEGLINAVSQLRSDADSLKKTGALLTGKILQLSPDIVFAQHYLGKQFFFDGNFSAAVPLLKKAVVSYRERAKLKIFLKNDLAIPEKMQPGDSAILHDLMKLHYDECEDHYLLAAVYEKRGDTVAALKEYGIISRIENKQQYDRASGAGMYQRRAGWERDDAEDAYHWEHDKNLKSYLYENDLDENGYTAKYDFPVLQGGSLKAAQISERSGKYLEAEKIFLNQVKQNQAAGFARLKKVDSLNLHAPVYGDKNYDQFYGDMVHRILIKNYWLYINEIFERETFHFYERMIALFPRDQYWYKNAGLFLFNRLWMTYQQTELGRRPAYYDFSTGQSYPFTENVEEANMKPGFGGSGMPREMILPGTGEQFKGNFSIYDPVVKAGYFLQQACRFSGNKLPDPELTADLAEVQVWQRKYDSAIINYRTAVNVKPENVNVRNRLIDVLNFRMQLPEAAQNMEVLLRSNRLSPEQKATLADYEMLHGKYDAAKSLLTSVADGDLKNRLLMKLYLLTNNDAKLFSTLRESIPKDTAYRNTYLYAEARMYAVQKKPAEAFAVLDLLFKDHFKLFFVLSNDDAWKELRETENWKRITVANPFEDIYNESGDPTDKKIQSDLGDPLSKRIPLVPK